jgi:hypothetical protein
MIDDFFALVFESASETPMLDSGVVALAVEEVDGVSALSLSAVQIGSETTLASGVGAWADRADSGACALLSVLVDSC